MDLYTYYQGVGGGTSRDNVVVPTTTPTDQNQQHSDRKLGLRPGQHKKRGLLHSCQAAMPTSSPLSAFLEGKHPTTLLRQLFNRPGLLWVGREDWLVHFFSIIFFLFLFVCFFLFRRELRDVDGKTCKFAI
jgi:hypothetical protein